MSVFKTLVAFLLGTGAEMARRSVQLLAKQLDTSSYICRDAQPDCHRSLTVLVLGHVEAAQHHDSFLPIVSSLRYERWMGIEQLPVPC